MLNVYNRFAAAAFTPVLLNVAILALFLPIPSRARVGWAYYRWRGAVTVSIAFLIAAERLKPALGLLGIARKLAK